MKMTNKIGPIGKRVILLVALLSCVLSTSAGPLDGIFDSKETKQGKKNDAWYTANKDKIKVELKTLRWDTNEANVWIEGTIENLSDDKISAVVIEVVIVNKENKQEALRERMKIAVPAFKSETYKLSRLSDETPIRFGTSPGVLAGSELVKCLNRIKDFSWSFELVTVISNANDCECFNYYKIRSVWNPADK